MVRFESFKLYCMTETEWMLPDCRRGEGQQITLKVS